MKPRTTPTFKQKLFAKKYIELNGNGAQAALQVYDVKDNMDAKTMAFQNLQKPIVQETIKQLLDKAGLSIDSINEESRHVLEKGRDAKPTFNSYVSHLQFLYKLHNALPMNKSMRLNVSAKARDLQKPFDEIKKDLESTQNVTSNLLEDLNGS